MCMKIKDFKSDKINKLKKNGKETFYKIVSKTNSSPFKYFFWKGGWNKSSRDSAKIDFYEKMGYKIYFGFHVLLSLKDAKRFLRNYDRGFKIIKVTCYSEDFVSTGLTCNVSNLLDNIKCAVFTKCFVRKEELQ